MGVSPIFKKATLALFFSFLFLTLVYQPVVDAESVKTRLDSIEKYDVKNSTDNRTSFGLMGFGLGLAWLLLFIKGRPRLITIGILSLLTARWQHYGHTSGYLPTNSTEPFTSEEMFAFVVTLFSYLTFGSYFLRRRGRSAVMLAMMFHVWLETGYQMGYIDIERKMEDG